jgi:hypothetical protein
MSMRQTPLAEPSLVVQGRWSTSQSPASGTLLVNLTAVIPAVV